MKSQLLKLWEATNRLTLFECFVMVWLSLILMSIWLIEAFK